MRFSRAHPGGFWNTTGLGALVLAVFVLIQVLVFSVFAEAILGEQPGVTVEELGIGIAVAIATDGIMLLVGREIVPEFMTNIYRTATNLPLFWIALVIAAPLFEEFLFRGFLFSGWLNTRLRATGTILLTSALWTLIHVQYDVVQLLVVFVYGIVLGLARYRTGSLIAPLVIHGAINMIALLQVTLLVWSAS